MNFINRPFEQDDYPTLQALSRDIYRLAGPPVYATPGDLDWWRCVDEDPQAILGAHVWMDGARMVAFIWPFPKSVDMLVHPDTPELNTTLLAWAEDNRRSIISADEEMQTLRAWSLTQDGARNKALLLRGYVRQEQFFYFRGRSLDAPIPAPALPDGYTLRTVAGEADLVRRVDVHRDAFSPSKLTVEKYRRALVAPNYRPDLDIVAVAPDGTFAAFALAWYDEANDCGIFEPVGCHSAHRRKGLASAVLNDGFRRLKALGAHVAHVNSHDDNTAANALYESVGFREQDRVYAWVKTL